MEEKDYTFETERLLCRPLNESDREFYIGLYTDEKTMRCIGNPLSLNRAEKAFKATVSAMVKGVKGVERTLMTWVIILKGSGEKIGIQAISFRPVELLHLNESGDKSLDFSKEGEVEFGIILSRQSHGRQLPEEAIGGLVEFADKVLKVKKIFAIFAIKNRAVLRFVHKLGFEESERISAIDELSTYQYLPSDKVKAMNMVVHPFHS